MLDFVPDERFEQGKRALGMAWLVVFWGGLFFFSLVRPISLPELTVLYLGGIVISYIGFTIEFAEKSWLVRITYGGVAAFTLVSTIYVYLNYRALSIDRLVTYTPIEGVMAVGLILFITYLTYKEYGPELILTVAAIIAYVLFGHLIPGLFGHAFLSFDRFILASVMNIKTGIYGSLTQIMVTWVSLFILYSGLVQAYGGIDLLKIGTAVINRRVGSGTAQTSVVMSMIIGSINGSAAANSGITGSITIPLMKESGIKGEIAAAIESVASTGGQILPPIMGASAFLMASLLGVSYTSIVTVAIIPAVLFYLTTALAVALTISGSASQSGQATAPIDHTDKSVPVEIVKFLVPFAVLIYTLVITGMGVMTSGVYTAVSMIAIGFAVPAIQHRDLATLRTAVNDTYEGARRGVVIISSLTLVAALIAIAVDLLLLTGLPNKVTIFIMDISGGSLLVAALVSFVVCIFLGFGMPTIAAYILVAILVVPPLAENFAIALIDVHFFVFYAAVLSALTPPVATAVIVTSGIANSNFLRTAFHALRIGVSFVVLPFVFVAYPDILVDPYSVPRLIDWLIVTVGLTAIVFGLNYPFENETRRVRTLLQGLFAVAGLAVIFAPVWWGQVGAVGVLGVLVLVVARQRLPHRLVRRPGDETP